MDGFTWNLLLAAVAVAFVHTALGPDHYLPFVMLARARRWSVRKTLAVTAACGVGHVLSSLVLGGIGIAIGIAVGNVEALESGRGSLAAWALLAFGAAYALWGVRHARRQARGLEVHQHGDVVHLHDGGDRAHGHRHEVPNPRDNATTFWALFVVFVLGPCETLIPLFVIPASEGRWGVAVAAGAVFSVVTVLTMLLITGIAVAGISHVPFGPLTRWSHALAGTVISASAAAVLFLGL